MVRLADHQQWDSTAIARSMAPVAANNDAILTMKTDDDDAAAIKCSIDMADAKAGERVCKLYTYHGRRLFFTLVN